MSGSRPINQKTEVCNPQSECGLLVLVRKGNTNHSFDRLDGTGIDGLLWKGGEDRGHTQNIKLWFGALPKMGHCDLAFTCRHVAFYCKLLSERTQRKFTSQVRELII